MLRPGLWLIITFKPNTSNGLIKKRNHFFFFELKQGVHFHFQNSGSFSDKCKRPIKRARLPPDTWPATLLWLPSRSLWTMWVMFSNHGTIQNLEMIQSSWKSYYFSGDDKLSYWGEYHDSCASIYFRDYYWKANNFRQIILTYFMVLNCSIFAQLSQYFTSTYWPYNSNVVLTERFLPRRGKCIKVMALLKGFRVLRL